MSLVDFKKQHDLNFATIFLKEKDLVYIIFKPDSEIGEKEVSEILQVCKGLSNNQTINYLHIHQDYTSCYSIDGRQYLAKHQSSFNYKSLGVVVKSLSQRMIANFYVRSAQPNFPYKVFSEEVEAEKWSKSLIA